MVNVLTSSFSYSLDGLSIHVLGLSRSTVESLEFRGITTIEQLALITLLFPLFTRRELTYRIERELEFRLKPYTIKCYLLSADAKGKPSRFVIKSTLFEFVASVLPPKPYRCTCIYAWIGPELNNCVPFHLPRRQETTVQAKWLTHVTRIEPEFSSPAMSPTIVSKSLAPQELVIQSTLHQEVAYTNDEKVDHSTPSQVQADILQPSDSVSLSKTLEVYSYTPIQNLPLITRTINGLLRGGIRTVGQIINASDEELLKLRNFGRSSLQEVRTALAQVRYLNMQQERDDMVGQESKLNSFWNYQISSDVNYLPISILELKHRTIHCLWSANVYTLGQLLQLTEAEVVSIRHLGQKGIDEISQSLKSLDVVDVLRFEGEIPNLDIIPIDMLELDDRIINGLLNAGIDSLGGLIKRGPAPSLEIGELRNGDITQIHAFLANLNLTKLRDIGDQLKRYNLTSNRQLESSVEANNELDTTLSLDSIIKQFLSHVPEREHQVLQLRFGLDGEEPRTLEQVGQLMSVTRERVRQIEKKAFLKLRAHRRVIQPVIYSLIQTLQNSHGVLSLAAAQNALCSSRAYGSIPPKALIELVLCFTTEIEIHKDLSAVVLKTEPFVAYTRFVAPVFKVIKQVLLSALAPISSEETIRRFATNKEGQTITLHVPHEFLLACIRAHHDIIIEQDGNLGLRQWKNTRLDDIILVLRHYGKPLHFAKVAERVNQRLPVSQQASAHNIHAQMGRLPDIFVRVGHGIFGLAEWGIKQDRTVGDAAYRVLRDAGHALDIEQITDYVLETWQVRRGSVYAAISLDKRFTKVGRNLYWIRDEQQVNKDKLPSNDFDTLFGQQLIERQQELQFNTEHDVGDTLEEVRRLGTDLFN